MSAQNLFLAVFLGNKTSARAQAWDELPERERLVKMQDGMAAWKAWVEKHQTSIAEMGGPLGKTKTVGDHGTKDITNALTAFTVVRAASHEAAAKLFEGHPHYTIFPGETIEIMPILPVPGA